MIARETYKMALNMLGYKDTDMFKEKSVVLVNRVYADLFYSLNPNGEFEPIKSLQDTIDLPQKVLHDVFPYGLAGFLAQSESDGDSQQLYMSIYNGKKNRLNNVASIEDVIPYPEG